MYTFFFLFFSRPEDSTVRNLQWICGSFLVGVDGAAGMVLGSERGDSPRGGFERRRAVRSTVSRCYWKNNPDAQPGR